MGGFIIDMKKDWENENLVILEQIEKGIRRVAEDFREEYVMFGGDSM